MFFMTDETGCVCFEGNFRFRDTAKLILGTESAGEIYSSTGNVYFKNVTQDKNISIYLNDGGVDTEVIRLVGSTGQIDIGQSGAPQSLLTVFGDESATEAHFSQALDKGGINIQSDYTANNWVPGIFWSTRNVSPTNPIAGIYVKTTPTGSIMTIGTSNNYGVGITSKITIDKDGLMDVVGALTAGTIASDDYVKVLDGNKFLIGTGSDGEIYSSSDDIYIKNVTQDKDIIFHINDGGVDTKVVHIGGAKSFVGIGRNADGGTTPLYVRDDTRINQVIISSFYGPEILLEDNNGTATRKRVSIFYGADTLHVYKITDDAFTRVSMLAFDHATSDASFGGNINVVDSKKYLIGTGLDGEIYSSSDDVYFKNVTQDKDLIFHVNDGGVDTEVLRFIGSASTIGTGGETAPDVSAGGICLNQNQLDTNIFTLKSTGDVAHGMTNYDQTDTYAALQKQTAASGGLSLKTYTGSNIAFHLSAAVTTELTDPTSAGAITFGARKKSGAGGTVLGNTAVLFALYNHNAYKFSISGNGDTWIAGNQYLLDDKKVLVGTGNDGEIYSNSDDVYIKNVTQDKDIIFHVNDGGVDTEVMRFDGSTSRVGIGNATVPFQSKVQITHPTLPSLSFFRDDGSVSTNNSLMLLDVFGRDGAGGVNTVARILVAASENWTKGAAQGAKMLFYTTVNGNPSQSLALTIDQNADLITAGNIKLADSKKYLIGTGLDGEIYSSGDDVYFKNVTQDKDIIFHVNDGGVDTEVMRFDGSTSRVGIGNASPDSKLDIKMSSSGAVTETLRLYNTGGGAGSGSAIDFYAANSKYKNARLHSLHTGVDQGDLVLQIGNGTTWETLIFLDGSTQSISMPASGGLDVTGDITGPNVTSGADPGHTHSTSVPAGTILSYGGDSLPDDFLFCDGSEISRTTYSDLFTAISTDWGDGDESTTFNLPDLRGKFLRGYDSGAGNDPDAGDRTAQDTGGATGDNVGSIQGYELEEHRHEYVARLDSGAGGNGDPQLGNNAQVVYQRFTLNTGGNETRPINASVMFIIKV